MCTKVCRLHKIGHTSKVFFCRVLPAKYIAKRLFAVCLACHTANQKFCPVQYFFAACLKSSKRQSVKKILIPHSQLFSAIPILYMVVHVNLWYFYFCLFAIFNYFISLNTFLGISQIWTISVFAECPNNDPRQTCLCRPIYALWGSMWRIPQWSGEILNSYQIV